MSSLLRLLSVVLILIGVQQRPNSATATIVVTVQGDGPASFAAQIPAGWDVTRYHASTGALSDDADPRGSPPSIVRWSGVVSNTAPALVWIELLASPHARSGAVVVGDRTVWVRAPGGVTPAPVKKVWLGMIRRG